MSIAPARIGGLRRHGQQISAGNPGNLTVVDPERSWVVDSAALESKSRNTPFTNHTMPATVIATVYEGCLTYTEGKVRAH